MASNKQKQYFNPEKARLLGVPPSNDFNICPDQTEKLQCYYNGIWYVCPNPLDKQRSSSLEQQYHLGYYISKDSVCIPKSDFNNLDNWNSQVIL